MPVEVIQVTSDQAKGLIACARDGLEAQHTPDLFHGQRELSRATSLPLTRQVEAAQKEANPAAAHTQEQRQRQQDYQRGLRPPGRTPDFAVAIGLAECVERQARTDLEQRQQRQEQAQQAVRGIAEDYHPFDAVSGCPLSVATISQRLDQRVRAVEEVVRAAKLGESSREAVAKTRRWLIPLVASLAWFWETVDELVSGLGLTAAASGRSGSSCWRDCTGSVKRRVAGTRSSGSSDEPWRSVCWRRRGRRPGCWHSWRRPSVRRWTGGVGSRGVVRAFEFVCGGPQRAAVAVSSWSRPVA